MWLVALPIFVLSCAREQLQTPAPAGAPAEEVALSGASVMIGAGDIAVCGTSGDEATAAIVDSVIKADSAAKVVTAVLTLGDNAYPSGREGVRNYFPRCFTPSWGTRRIMMLIRPSPGNHDYDSGSGAPYFSYFGERAGPPGKGYYSYDVGDWHVISLNSEIVVDRANLSEARAQEDWLRKDLNDHTRLCTLAYFHRPLFSSGQHGGTHEVQSLWRILYDGGVDLILNGHEHHYERFLPQTPFGVLDSLRGIQQIITGTGGGGLRGLRYPLAANSAVQMHGHFGVLKLSLGAGEYRHAFLDTDRRVWDQGGRKCH